MRIRDVFLIFLIILIGFSINNLLKIKEEGLPAIFQFGGKANYFLDIKEVPFEKGSHLDIQNNHGQIELIHWEQEAIKAELEKVIYSHDKKLAEEISAKIQFSLIQEQDRIRIETNRNEVPFRGLNVRTNMKIYLPTDTSASLTLAHGDIFLSDLKGIFKIEANHSDVEVRNIVGNVFVRAENGDLILKSIQGPVSVHLAYAESAISLIHDRLTLHLEHSSTELAKTSSDVIITSRHSEIEAQEIQGTFQADCENTYIYASQIGGETIIKNSHKDIILSNIKGPLKINSEHCDMEIEKIASHATILSEYGEVSFGIPSNLNFSVELLAKNGNIESDFDAFEPVEESRGVSLTGSIGEGGPLYKIETSYNEIYLEEIANDE